MCRTCDCEQGCVDDVMQEIKDCDKPCECVLSASALQDEIPNLILPDLGDIGFIEKDGITGPTREDERIRIDAVMETNTTAYIGGNNW